jgi:hypothetical protein
VGRYNLEDSETGSSKVLQDITQIYSMDLSRYFGCTTLAELTAWETYIQRVMGNKILLHTPGKQYIRCNLQPHRPGHDPITNVSGHNHGTLGFTDAGMSLISE